MEGKFNDREDLEMLGFSLIFVYIWQLTVQDFHYEANICSLTIKERVYSHPPCLVVGLDRLSEYQTDTDTDYFLTMNIKPIPINR